MHKVSRISHRAKPLNGSKGTQCALKSLGLLVMFMPLYLFADSRLTTLPGFTITTLNFAVPNARQMALTDGGILIVGTRRAGKVYAVPNALTATAPEVHVLAEDLTMPSGVAIHQGDLYIGATNKVLRVRNIDKGFIEPALETITDQLPDERHHGWKYLKFGPDDSLYVPVGAPCNICLSDDARFATILRMDPNSGETTIYAAGIRNSVGFDWHPTTQALWFTDNGRDMMGDDIPAEELNTARRAGLHFGYPFLHADGIKDPEFGDHVQANKQQFTAPRLMIQAHSAALGMVFHQGKNLPEDFSNALFIAEHGSWNRTSKVGYQVSLVRGFAEDKLVYQPFVTGWLEGETAWGRPNDVLVTPDGDLLISDDKAGVIYRVRYAP